MDYLHLRSGALPDMLTYLKISELSWDNNFKIEDIILSQMKAYILDENIQYLLLNKEDNYQKRQVVKYLNINDLIDIFFRKKIFESGNLVLYETIL